MKQGSADDPFADEVTDDSNELTEADATETLNPDTDVDAEAADRGRARHPGVGGDETVA